MTTNEKLQCLLTELQAMTEPGAPSDRDHIARAALVGLLRAILEEPRAVMVVAKIDRPEGAALAPGDVVRLRSGGPEMTVLSQLAADREEVGGWLVCQFFDANTLTARSTTLPPAALCRVDGDLKILRNAWVALDAVNVAAELAARGAVLTDVEQNAPHALVVDARAAIGDRLGKAGQ